MTTLTKTAERKIRKRLAALRAEHKAWLSGQRLHWGMAWCPGPGGAHHQPPACEGCVGREWAQEHALPIAGEIGRLEGLLAPTVQGVLW